MTEVVELHAVLARAVARRLITRAEAEEWLTRPPLCKEQAERRRWVIAHA